MVGLTAKIPLTDIRQVRIYINENKKTVAQIKAATGADYVINGGYFNRTTFQPANWLIADGVAYNTPNTVMWGYRLDTGLPELAKSARTYIDFIQSTPLLVAGGRVNDQMLISGLDNSDRGRSAMGLTADALVLRCVPDVVGASDDTCAELAADMVSQGCLTAIGLDGGGSSQCDFAGETVTSTRIVHNFILVFLKKEEYIMPTVRAYNAFTEGSKKLSANFTVSEFQCHDGSGAVLIADELVAVEQAARDKTGAAINNNSGYRTNAYNKTLPGAATESKHLYGLAADTRSAKLTIYQLAALYETILAAKGIPGGIGLYEKDGFVHVDVRTAKSRWKQDKSGNMTYGLSGF